MEAEYRTLRGRRGCRLTLLYCLVADREWIDGMLDFVL